MLEHIRGGQGAGFRGQMSGGRDLLNLAVRQILQDQGPEHQGIEDGKGRCVATAFFVFQTRSAWAGIVTVGLRQGARAEIIAGQGGAFQIM